MLISRVPKKIFIIIDSAYAEYVTDKDYSNGINFAKKYKNIIVTRTFSKIYGLASLRLGWCYAHTDIIKLMNKVRGPFNVNQIAQLAGVEALKDKKYEKNAFQVGSIFAFIFEGLLDRFWKDLDSQFGPI